MYAERDWTTFSNQSTALNCLISVGDTNSQRPTLFFDYKLKRPTLISSVKKFKQGKYYKINVGHTKFQST